MTTTIPPLATITIELGQYLAEIRLNRPGRSNAMREKRLPAFKN